MSSLRDIDHKRKPIKYWSQNNIDSAYNGLIKMMTLSWIKLKNQTIQFYIIDNTQYLNVLKLFYSWFPLSINLRIEQIKKR